MIKLNEAKRVRIFEFILDQFVCGAKIIDTNKTNLQLNCDYVEQCYINKERYFAEVFSEQDQILISYGGSQYLVDYEYL